MKVYTYTEDITVDTSGISADPHDILYFDIETTGLSAARSDLYLIGYGYLEDDHFNTVLLFNNDGKSEPEMLQTFQDKLSSFGTLVSYNGDTFDIPYMKTKHDQFDVSTTIDTIRSFDIYKITRKYKKLFNLSSMKQVDVEDLTGFARCSFISGGKLIEAYKSYLKYPSKTLLSDMLTHNHDDIRGLISISEFANMPYITSEAKIRDVIINTDSLTYICNVKKLPCRITYSDKNNNRIVLNAHDTELRLTVSRTNDTLKYYFKDYKNYFYLPLEDMAIHKSTAIYVDNDHKEKATKDTAYVKKRAIYLPSPAKCSDKMFFKGDRCGERFIEETEALSSICDTSNAYIKSILSEILPECKKQV